MVFAESIGCDGAFFAYFQRNIKNSDIMISKLSKYDRIFNTFWIAVIVRVFCWDFVLPRRFILWVLTVANW